MIITNKHIVLLSLGLIIFSGLGCQKSDSNSENSSIQIQGTSILENEEPIISFNTAGSYLIGTLYDNDDVYTVYKLPELDSLGRIGKIGIGPGEWKGPNITGQVDEDSNTTSVWINDGITNELFLLNIDSSLSLGRPYLAKNIKLHPKYNLNQYSYVLNNNTIIGNAGFNSFEAFRLQKVDLSNGSIQKSELIPEIEGIEQASVPHKYSTYFSYIGMKPDKSLFVSAMNSINRIDIFNANLELIATFEEPSNYRYLTPKYINDMTTSQLFFRSVCVTDNFIYALRTNALFKEAMTKNHTSELLIFDWSLNLLKTIEISDYLIALALDESNGTFYGVDYYNQKFLKYDLNKFLPIK